MGASALDPFDGPVGRVDGRRGDRAGDTAQAAIAAARGQGVGPTVASSRRASLSDSIHGGAMPAALEHPVGHGGRVSSSIGSGWRAAGPRTRGPFITSRICRSTKLSHDLGRLPLPGQRHGVADS